MKTALIFQKLKRSQTVQFFKQKVPFCGCTLTVLSLDKDQTLTFALEPFNLSVAALVTFSWHWRGAKYEWGHPDHSESWTAAVPPLPDFQRVPTWGPAYAAVSRCLVGGGCAPLRAQARHVRTARTGEGNYPCTPRLTGTPPTCQSQFFCDSPMHN